MNDLIAKDNIKIEDLIYEIRGKQVMLDSDLAVLYGCKNGTKSINLAVKRHINRFPERFCFKLTEEESKNFWFQLETKKDNIETRGGKYDRPYAFTEQGVAMLSAVLRTEVAGEVSIKIMDAFVAMRKYISSNLIEQKYINNMVLKHEESINLLQESFEKLETKEKEKINHIFFEGQIYDAYSLMMDILGSAKEEIIIIDNYAGKKLFDLLRDIKVNIKVYSKNFDLELIKYSNISTFIHNGFHDRFIILDKNILYHCGASFKDLGVKCFAINKVDNPFLLENILSYLKN